MSSTADIIFPTITSTVEKFFKPERKRHQELMAELIRENHALGGHEYGFYHNGQLYSSAPPFKLRGYKIRTAYPVIGARVEDLVAAQQRLKDDVVRMNNGLSVIAARCESFQQYRDSIPEPLVSCTPFSQYPRQSEEASALRHNPILLQQFKKLEAIVLYYSANALIY